MRQRLLIFLGLIFLTVLLIGLNAASYVQKEKVPDTEFNPNRSTFNTGATGTRAFYDLLAETGRKVTRWQEPPSALSSSGANKPSTFIIIGPIRREFTDNEATQLLNWVSAGGKLVIIDREPPANLITTTANYSVSIIPEKEPLPLNIDPSNQNQMTANTQAAKPVQLTIFTKSINAVQPSRSASTVNFERFPEDYANEKRIITAPAPQNYPEPKASEDYEEPPSANAPANSNKNFEIMEARTPIPIESGSENNTGSPPPQIITGAEDEITESPALLAPVAHLANNEKTLLVDVSFGSGQIVFLTDPFIVSNGGISLVDNAQIGINTVASREGVIAFDEYHQGYGANENRLLQYFAGTPVVAIFLQLAILIGLILLSQSRRFARPLPADEPNRLSKLEYVAAMAELQRRTKAFDLALENIYSDFRRRVSRLVGVDNFTVSRKELARLLAERLNADEFEIYNLMRQCVNIIHGEPTNKKEILSLTSRLREIEEKLGLKRSRKQIFRK
ncbi:MAG TPA: DUF4350 domain-containing protein [Pyrinomonadaceae bacterium]|nr:DUF4350 domain-containing protein [Pyrinomonadaceae bacterium]